MNKDFFANKKVLIMGLGRFGGGVDVARFACDAGAKVTITDLAECSRLTDSISRLEKLDNIEYHLGSHEPADFEQSDVIIANPAVPIDNEFLKIARHKGRLVSSQIEIFFQLCPATIIGITGANGKSTTAALTAHLLRNSSDESPATSHVNVWLSGNIGNEPLLSIIEQIGPQDLVVLELSSFQLEQLARIKKAPKIALLTNLTPNHLDRHGTFENYCIAKENIFNFQKLDDKSPAISIFNAEDKIGAGWFDKYREQPGRICLKFSAGDVTEQIRSRFSLPGRANLSNLAAAVTIARYFGVDDERIKSSLPQFKPLPHRLELVAQIEAVSWYNDSIATTPESTIAALNAFEQPVIIIAGGYDKNLPFDKLGEEISRKAKAAILIGQTAKKIASSIRASSDERRATEIIIVKSLADAVDTAYKIAQPNDVVLLSPACASYDMFENFQHRGKEFVRLARRIST